jgi:hypothetical protein
LVREIAPKLKEAPVHGEWWQIGGVTGRRLTGADKWAAVEDIARKGWSFL